jgi:2-polyprenyl-6-methoxyphenol hydroxylase-like FAD-dependent oxidoreductase
MSVTHDGDILIAGAGIGGLTLALALHRAGISCRLLEAAATFGPVGVGINLLPHAVKELTALGVADALEGMAVATRQASFYNRFGQHIYTEPLGRHAGFAWPQLSIHRADLHAVLLDAVRDRIGAHRIVTGARVTAVEQNADGVMAHLAAPSGAALPAATGRALIAADGIHSAVRRQLYPQEGPPRYSGINMWRGVTRWAPFLSGADMVRAGWLATGKMVIYPIRDRIDSDGRQLVNWVAEIETPRHLTRDWNRSGRLEDCIWAFADWRFDWLDVLSFIRAADVVLEFPMVDQDPLPAWSFDRITLLGDAAHPMVPRGSNGAGQAILDGVALADCLARTNDIAAALKDYEGRRLEATSAVVLANRTQPPDAILGEVYRRTGDKPFARIEDVIAREELQAMSEGYKRISGSSQEALGTGI